MFDPNFDPYLELQETKVEILKHQNVIRRLVDAHNQFDSAFVDLSHQHRQLVDLLKQTRNQVLRLEEEIKKLKSQTDLNSPL